MDLWKSLPEGYEAMPTIEYYKAENKTTDAVFVIFPGGGYSHHSEPEGAGYAKMFNVWGADAFVVKYSVAPSVFPCQLCDAKRAVQIVRANAPQYGINPENDEISKENFLPNYQVLCYPVITLSDDDIVNKGSRRHLIGENYDIDLARKLSPQLVCDEKTPPAFIWHNADDGAVHVFNSINYAKSLREHNVPVELHIFPFGGHGIAAAAEKHSGQWMGLLFNWLKEMNIY